jgi:chemotaxis protein MotB
VKPGSEPRHSAQDRWLVSYADFITLLFAFFATMYAISSVDAKKLTTIAHALQVAFDDSARGRSVASGTGVLPERGARLTPGAQPTPNVQDFVVRELAAELAAHRIDLRADRRGLVLSIPETGLFDVGSDEIAPSAQALIGRLATTLATIPNSVRVEGHTDDLPIHTPRFRSNWDLSAARATRVIEFLVDRAGVAPQRLSVAGYAEFRPRVPNASPEGRAQNRRVDLVILNDTTAQAEEPLAEPPG